MSARTFHLPDLGEGLQEAEIVTWHVSVGEHVVTDQPLVAVETDKAVVEVPSPRSGRIARLCAEPGERVPVGAPLVEFDDGAAADTGTVVGKISAEAAPAKEEAEAAAPMPRVGVKATPAVRALARKLGVDLAAVDASGPNRVITKEDVERAAADLAEAGPLEPLRGVRRAMAERMANAHAQVVPATVTDEADIDTWPRGSDVTVRLIRAIAVACKAQPAMNAWFDSTKMGRRLHKRIDLGIAVNTDDGLFVPVMRDVGNRDAQSLRAGLENLKADVQARSIPPEELRGQTITLSNFGMIAGRFTAMVVVPPQVAIVGVGRIEARVVAVDSRPAVHRVLPVSITFDHRAVTGAEAGRFLAALIEDLERAE